MILYRAFFGAGTAVGALGRIDGSQEIGDRDRFTGAHLGAHHATDTARGANLADNRPFIMRRAADMYFAAEGNQLDQLMRAGLGASATPGAKALIHHGNAVFNAESTKFAGGNTIAITDAAIAQLFLPR